MKQIKKTPRHREAFADLTKYIQIKSGLLIPRLPIQMNTSSQTLLKKAKF